MQFEFLGELIQVIGHKHYLVASWTFPGEWYAVEADGCTCRAWECLKDCRHFRAIQELERELREPSSSRQVAG